MRERGKRNRREKGRGKGGLRRKRSSKKRSRQVSRACSWIQCCAAVSLLSQHLLSGVLLGVHSKQPPVMQQRKHF